MSTLKITNTMEVDKHIIDCIADLNSEGTNPIDCTFVYGSNPMNIRHSHVATFASLSGMPFTKKFSGGYSTTPTKKGRTKNGKQ